MSTPAVAPAPVPRIKAVHFVHEQANPVREALQGGVGVRMVTVREELVLAETKYGVLVTGNRLTYLVPWDGVKRVEYDQRA